MNKIEVFSAGCPLCDEVIERLNREVCESCEMVISNLREPMTAKRAKEYGIKRAPAVVANGKLSQCCKCQDVAIKF